jgi:hypothetical protein
MKNIKNWELILQNNGLDLASIDQELFNDFDSAIDLIKIAVVENGLAMKYVPEEFQTEEICQFAIFQNIYSINFIVNLSDFLLEFIYDKYGIDKCYELNNPKINEYIEIKQKELNDKINNIDEVTVKFEESEKNGIKRQNEEQSKKDKLDYLQRLVKAKTKFIERHTPKLDKLNNIERNELKNLINSIKFDIEKFNNQINSLNNNEHINNQIISKNDNKHVNYLNDDELMEYINNQIISKKTYDHIDYLNDIDSMYI